MAEPNRSGGGNVTSEADLDSLGAIGPRRAGSEAERRAARQIERRLRELGRDVQVEPTRIRPAIALTHLIHAVAGIVASVLAVYEPLWGLVLAALATASAFGELTGTFRLVGLLTPARASQNVVSDRDTGKPGLIVLVAHYDTPRDAAIFGARFSFWPRALLGSLALVTLCAAGRLAGLDATWFTVIQFIPTVALIASIPLFADAALAPNTDGAADNSAGVATAFELAGTQLEHFDVMLVFTGASAHAALGMHEWLKRHRKELNPESTAVISLDNLAGGTPTYAAKEGPVVASRMHPTLTELAADSASAFSSRELSDAYRARAAGLPSIRISSVGDEDDPGALERVRDVVADLLRAIDEEIGPRIA